MQFCIPHITTVVLLLHLGLGCCWHHSFTCKHDEGHQTATNDVTCSCHEPGHAGNELGCATDGFADGTAIHPGHSRHGHHCDGDHCTFVRSFGSSERAGELRLCVHPLETAGRLAPLDAPLQQSTGESLLNTRYVSLTLRAHLVLSVLLI